MNPTPFGANLPIIKESNRSTVLSAIWKANPISRIELARLLRLAPTTVSRIVGEFMRIGLIREIGKKNRGVVGRKAILLEVNPKSFRVIGVDLGRESVTAVLMDLDGNIERKSVLNSGISGDSYIDNQNVVEIIKNLISHSGLDGKIIGIGVGAPGYVNNEEGIVVSAPRFPGWKNVPLRSLLEKSFGLRVCVDNDANTCALAEKWFGITKNIDDFVYLAIEKGLGAGVVVGGKLYRGMDNAVGEIGHTTVNPAGSRCNCGNIGCLELYVTGPAFIKKARKLGLNDSEAANSRSIFELARIGNSIAIRAVEDLVYYLGIGVVNVVNSFNPEVVVLGREVPQAGKELLLKPLKRIVKERAFPTIRDKVKVALGGVNEYPSAVGAATLLLVELQKSPFALTGTRESLNKYVD